MTAAHFRNGPVGARYVFDADVPFGLPFRPTPFTATFDLTIEGTPVTTTIPFQSRSEGDIFSGEKRSEIHVVPAFAVAATPEIVVVSTSDARTERRQGHGHESRERRRERGRDVAAAARLARDAGDATGALHA